MRVLDTDHCVELLRGNVEVIRHRGEVADLVATTWVTAGELYFGAARSKRPGENKKRVDELLETLPLLSPGADAAKRLGALKGDLETSGQRVPDADLWIAAMALAEAATLVTGNERHYARIPGLKMETWIPRERK